MIIPPLEAPTEIYERIRNQPRDVETIALLTSGIFAAGCYAMDKKSTNLTAGLTVLIGTATLFGIVVNFLMDDPSEKKEMPIRLTVLN